MRVVCTDQCGQPMMVTWSYVHVQKYERSAPFLLALLLLSAWIPETEVKGDRGREEGQTSSCHAGLLVAMVTTFI